MASSLLDALTGLVTPGALSAASTRLGEPAANLSRGLNASFATALGGLATRAGDTGLLQQVIELGGDRNVAAALSDVPALFRGTARGASGLSDIGGRFLSMILGPQQSGIVDAIGRSLGIKPGTISSLLSLAAPLILGVLGKRVKDDGLGAAGLGNLLSREKDSILTAAPAGISSLLGGMGRQATTAVKTGINWLWPILGVLALALILWWIARRKAPEVTVPAISTAPVATAAADVASFIKRALPGGVELSFAPRGIEAMVIEFIESPRPADETTWFDFDRLLFETGSATLKPESQAQLRNVAEILKAYPSVKVKVGGYTDNVGDPAANLKLSQDRAGNVVQELLGMGIASDRLSAEGYGEQHPVADNSTEEGRAKNRRIALRVTAK
jgi:outer membrane protein OmpA-like peptidoglycan-associated protein